MRVTIIKDGGAVMVDGEHYAVDCSSLPADFHALQWDGNRGEVEYVPHMFANDASRWHKKPNDVIFDLAPYQQYVDAWQHAKDEVQKAREAAAARLAGLPHAAG